MPLPTDQNLLNLSDKILATFTQIFGEHPGIRPAHGKGTLLRGAFTPTAAAADLSIAQHFQQALTPVLVRFSDSTGLPDIPDTDPNTLPKGIAVRFLLAEHVHTDVIAHSIDGFPTRPAKNSWSFSARWQSAIRPTQRAHRWRPSSVHTQRRCASCRLLSPSRSASRGNRFSA